MRPTCFADWSRLIESGSVARIQKLPSSSLGMNSVPMKRRSAPAAATGASARRSAATGRRSENANNGR